LPDAPTSPRARYREQVRAEILNLAWRQIADAGSAALSLRAIAQQMGMTAPALYRYFASRDELLTELIVGAYRDLAETVEQASGQAEHPASELRDLARVLRGWATEHPQRYLLLYGTPVPGYQAPTEATALTTRIFTPVLKAFNAATTTTRRRDHTVTRRDRGPGFGQSVRFWTRLHGVLSLELAGHFVGMDIDVDELYDQETQAAIGLKS
jgi:AcrR family transcriptional regulator